MNTPKRAWLVRSRGIYLMAAILALLTGWLLRHIYALTIPEASASSLALVWFTSFLAIMWTLVLAMLEKPRVIRTVSQQKYLDSLSVAVLIPAYNEDEQLLQACIQSIITQSRLPDIITVVDDGSTSDYQSVRDWLATLNGRYPTIKLYWKRTANSGKRHAQVVGMMAASDADIYITVDSDTVLDHYAIEEGLKPFVDSRIQSVAGVCLPLNVSDNLLTRFTGLWETIWQIVERSSQSTMNCVTVNTGILAFYRAETIRPYIKSYLTETFFGNTVKFSDDSLMTLYALSSGRTIQQPSSLSFSAVPNKYSHHIRRYVRWMRGSFIRTWWRFKYLPLTSYVYWLHLFRWVQFALSLVVVTVILKSGMLTDTSVLPYLIAVPIILSYIQSLRYFTIKRNDESRGQQILTYLTAPIAMLWLLTVLRVTKWYAYATVFKTGWGTRQSSIPEVTVKI